MQVLLFEQRLNGVNAETVDAAIEPEAQHVLLSKRILSSILGEIYEYM